MVVGGVSYLESSYFEHSLDCPEGFTLAGDVKLDGYSDPRLYYTSPDQPDILLVRWYPGGGEPEYWVYVRLGSEMQSP